MNKYKQIVLLQIQLDKERAKFARLLVDRNDTHRALFDELNQRTERHREVADLLQRLKARQISLDEVVVEEKGGRAWSLATPAVEDRKHSPTIPYSGTEEPPGAYLSREPPRTSPPHGTPPEEIQARSVATSSGTEVCADETIRPDAVRPMLDRLNPTFPVLSEPPTRQPEAPSHE